MAQAHETFVAYKAGRAVTAPRKSLAAAMDAAREAAPSGRIDIRSDYTSDGTHYGHQRGRIVAHYDGRRWTVDYTPAASQRAAAPVALPAKRSKWARPSFEIPYGDLNLSCNYVRARLHAYESAYQKDTRALAKTSASIDRLMTLARKPYSKYPTPGWRRAMTALTTRHTELSDSVWRGREAVDAWKGAVSRQCARPAVGIAGTAGTSCSAGTGKRKAPKRLQAVRP